MSASSEVLTEETRSLAMRAWKVPVFNVYAATETGGIAAECDRHQGMHLFEDLVIPEVVDHAYRPVPPAATGGTVRIRPVAFHHLLDLTDAAGWQVRQGAQELTVLVAAPGADFDPTTTAQTVTAALAAVGAGTPVRVEVVDEIPAGPAGKRPLIVVHQLPPAGAAADPHVEGVGVGQQTTELTTAAEE